MKYVISKIFHFSFTIPMVQEKNIVKNFNLMKELSVNLLQVLNRQMFVETFCFFCFLIKQHYCVLVPVELRSLF